MGLVLGVVLDQLAVGTVLLGLVLTAYAAIESHGPARVAGLLVGVAAVVVPFVSWQRRWSDGLSWLRSRGPGHELSVRHSGPVPTRLQR